MKSGAMITVGFALEQGRDVFSVPGNIDSPQSFGTNHLIRLGAKPVLTAEDILEEYNLDLPIHTQRPDPPWTRRTSYSPPPGSTGVGLDDLCYQLGLPGSRPGQAGSP